ncbi:MAG TPA: 2-amino-4-hydroxy-6-hydroxymethyldihydropteridine diphosphokinase [Planctomycetaceae bacterium]|nr:2-amino-4-hydroxy-6-hydroxymethyldihydropteridine diphosphokinase [Planctomycetaceae bacterium]
MPRCWIGMGGNQGDVPATFERALAALSHARGVTPVVTSRNYRTAPMGAAAGEPFLNAVAGFDVTRPPLELLDLLQTVEQSCGRVRTIPWGPRTLDLDLLYYGDELVQLPRLTVPHPGVWHRRFVLDPLASVAPTWVDPTWDLTVSVLQTRLVQRPPCVTVFGATEHILGQLQTALSEFTRSVELRENDVAAALRGGLVIQLGPVVTPLVPRFRMAVDIAAEELIRTVTDAVTAAFDEPCASSD